jgi:serine/threonine-protein kinase
MPQNVENILFEKFSIIDCLKKDDHAAVYLADHVYLNKKIILKVLNTGNLPDASILQRFKREARILAKIDNRYIIRVLDFGTSGEKFYISFEYFPSRNMRSFIKNTQLTDESKKDLAVQLFRGIAHAHANGIIHRDIKPENIFISDSLELKLGDFGLAKSLNENYATSDFSVMGTPCYMSPEQVLGEELASASDLFSAGIVIYELYTGKNPFLGNDVTDTINRVLRYGGTEELENLEQIPDEIRIIITGLLQKEASGRLVSAEKALEMLGDDYKSFTNEKISEKTAGRKTETNKKKNIFTGINNTAIRNYALVALIVLALVVTVLYAFYRNIYNQIASGVAAHKTDTIYIFRPSLPFAQSEKQQIAAGNEEEKNKKDGTAEKMNKPETAVKINSGQTGKIVRKTGKLFVICSPWANIYIDSVKMETTPLKGDLIVSEGEHSLQLVNPHFPSYVKKIYIHPEGRTEIKVNLDTLFGYLECKVNPWGEVFVNGRLIGQTPLQAPVKLTPGEYTVILKNSSFLPMEFRVKIERNKTYVLKHNFKN